MGDVGEPPYSPDTYAAWQDGAARSARAVLEVIWPLVAPQRVVDVGCGIGLWLAEAERRGAAVLRGFDGPWVEPGQLRSAAIRFTSVDLEQGLPEDERYDLAISVEVAEHVSRDGADRFLDALVRLSDVIVFSAAIPGQGGVSHVNEQWPSYWARRFAARGFSAFDVVRQAVWTNGDVEWWYRQNLLLYVRDGSTAVDRATLRTLERPPLDLVHPDLYDAKVAEILRVHERPDGRFAWQTVRRWLFGGPRREPAEQVERPGHRAS